MGVKLNGVDLESTFGFILNNVEGLESPGIRQNTVVIPGLHGELDFGGTYDTRNLFLFGYIDSATSHDSALSALQSFLQTVAVTPLKTVAAPLEGFPLSPTSVLGALELPDFTDRYFQVIFNGVFESNWAGPRQLSRTTKIRIGFRQPNPWASANQLSKSTAATDNASARFNVINDGAIHVPPNMFFEGSTIDTVTSFSLYNMGVDPFVTKSIAGTIGGSPVFRGPNYSNGIIQGAIEFAADTDFVTFPMGSNIFSQEAGTIECVYTNTSSVGATNAVIWTLYVSISEYWACFYDGQADRFKIIMTDSGGTVTLTSTVGSSGLNKPHYLVFSWYNDSVSFWVNNNNAVTGSENRIAYPSTIRLGSLGNNTFAAKGMIEELIIWNHDVGQSYVIGAYNNNRTRRPFGRPVPGVLLYASFNYDPNAVGCGDKVFTYSPASPIELGDFLAVDMERHTATFWDSSAKMKSNAIASVSNHFFEMMPGVNTLYVSKSGLGHMIINTNFQKRYLL